MSTDLPRFTITLPEDVYSFVLQYKEENKISTQSKAIQKLILVGIESITKEKGGSYGFQYSPDEKALVAAWRRSEEKDRKTAACALDFQYVSIKKEA